MKIEDACLIAYGYVPHKKNKIHCLVCGEPCRVSCGKSGKQDYSHEFFTCRCRETHEVIVRPMGKEKPPF